MLMLVKRKKKKWEATDSLNNDRKKEKNVSQTNELTMRLPVYWYTFEEPEAHSMEESVVSNLLASKLPPDLTWPNLMWL